MRKASAAWPSGCVSVTSVFSPMLALGDARDAPQDGHAQRVGDLVRGAHARVELLQQEGEADAGEEADAEPQDGAAQGVRRERRRGHGGRHQHAVVAGGRAVADLQVLQALLEHQVVGRLVGGLRGTRRAAPGRRRRPWRSELLLALLAPVDEGLGVGVGGLGGDLAATSLVAEMTTTLLPLVELLPVSDGLRAGAHRVVAGCDALLLQQLVGALLHVRAGDDVADGGHLAVQRVGVDVGLAEGVGDVDVLLVDERRAGLVLLGLARREEVGGGGGDDDDEEDDPLAAPEHAEVVAQGETLGLPHVRHARRRAGGRVAQLLPLPPLEVSVAMRVLSSCVRYRWSSTRGGRNPISKRPGGAPRPARCAA